MYDAQGNLTRAAMRQVLAEHGSVLWRGRLITSEEQLPSEADLAVGHPDRAAQVAQALDTQIGDLLRQRAQLVPPPPPPAEGVDGSGRGIPPEEREAARRAKRKDRESEPGAAGAEVDEGV